jgi:hypothetical protein
MIQASTEGDASMKIKITVTALLLTAAVGTAAHAQGYNRYEHHYYRHGNGGALVLGGVIGALGALALSQPHYIQRPPTYFVPDTFQGYPPTSYYMPQTVYVPGHYETR